MAAAAGKEIIKNIPPFSANETVAQVDPTAPFETAAFNLDLTPNQYYSDPVVGRDHVYVIALQKNYLHLFLHLQPLKNSQRNERNNKQQMPMPIANTLPRSTHKYKKPSPTEPHLLMR